MGLKIMRDPNGAPRKTWWARMMKAGRRETINLNIPIDGQIPVDQYGRYTLKLKGDAAFEKSKKAALKAFLEMSNRAKNAENETALIRAAYKVTTGRKMKDVPLAQLPELWRNRARTRTPSENKMKFYDATFKHFATFAAHWCEEYNSQHPNEKLARTCRFVNEITPEIATAWFNKLRETYAWETVKSRMSLLKGAFKLWSTAGQTNPFGSIIKRHGGDAGGNRVRRKALSESETARVFEYSREDPALHDLIVCAACTGMRIIDVCHLKWDDIDLKGGFMVVETSKTGETVTIPIFAPLREVLMKARQDNLRSPFVFPDAAEGYERNRTGLMRAVKPIIARAVFGDEDVTEIPEVPESPLTHEQILDAIDHASWIDTKKSRIRDVFIRFGAGDSYSTIAAATNSSKGRIAQDLESVEELIGQVIRPGASPRKKLSATKLVGKTRNKRKIGKCAASIYGWHSFRTSFVVLAIEAGVPTADVQKIVGHTTLRMTLDYYRPNLAHTAERIRRQMKNSILAAPEPVREIVDASPNTPAPATISKDDFIASLSEEERKDLARKLLGL